MDTSFLRFILAAAFAAVIAASSLAAPEPPTRVYFAKVTVKISPVGNDTAQRLRAHLPKDDPSVTMAEVRNTGIFEIGVTASEPQAAAKRANEIALSVKTALSSDANPKILKIWEKAEPPVGPLVPKK